MRVLALLQTRLASRKCSAELIVAIHDQYVNGAESLPIQSRQDVAAGFQRCTSDKTPVEVCYIEVQTGDNVSELGQEDRTA